MQASSRAARRVPAPLNARRSCAPPLHPAPTLVWSRLMEARKSRASRMSSTDLWRRRRGGGGGGGGPGGGAGWGGGERRRAGAPVPPPLHTYTHAHTTPRAPPPPSPAVGQGHKVHLKLRAEDLHSLLVKVGEHGQVVLRVRPRVGGCGWVGGWVGVCVRQGGARDARSPRSTCARLAHARAAHCDTHERASKGSRATCTHERGGKGSRTTCTHERGGECSRATCTHERLSEPAGLTARRRSAPGGRR